MKKKIAEKHIDDVTQVIRISLESYKKLKKFAKSESEDKGARVTMIDVFNRIVDTVETLADGPSVYILGSKVFKDPASARGEAIMNSVLKGLAVEKAKVAIVIGDDEG